jgi:ubiquinone biosynthesis protein
MRLLRLFSILRIGLRHGLDEFLLAGRGHGVLQAIVDALTFRRNFGAPRGVRLREAFQELGPIFIKFGQVLSTRPDLIPADLATELAKLQDKVPPFADAEVAEVLAAAYGKPIDQVFSTFTFPSVAAASVAQVHRATLAAGPQAGRTVAVKIIRPGIEGRIARDVAVLDLLAGWVERLFADGRRLRPRAVVREFATTLYDELDLIREAASASQLRRNFAAGTLLYVPEVYWDFCHRNVMVMEWIDALPVNDIAGLKAHGIDLDKLGREGVEIFFTQVFRDAFFHADMHPGNIFVLKDGRYTGVDFGIMGTLSERDKQYLATNFMAFFRRDYRRVAVAHIDAGWVPADTRVDAFESAIRSVCEPIFGRPLKEIYFGRVLLRLFDVSRRFQMEVQPQLVLLQKTLLQIEGLGRQLNPDLDMIPIAEPILRRWMQEQVGLSALRKAVREEGPLWARSVPEVPRLVHRLLADDPSTRLSAAIDRLVAMQRRQTRVLWGMAVLLGVLVAGYLVMALDYFRVW